MGQNGIVNTHLQPNSRLRMSNASLGKKKNNQFRGGSSKSSVASSQVKNHTNEQLNPFIKNNYENDNLFQNNQIIHHQGFNQQQQFQFQQQQNQQQQQQIDYTIKNFSPQNIRLLQEVGKGRFGSVFTGELIGTFGPNSNSIVKATIKTLKTTGSKAQNRF